MLRSIKKFVFTKYLLLILDWLFINRNLNKIIVEIIITGIITQNNNWGQGQNSGWAYIIIFPTLYLLNIQLLYVTIYILNVIYIF